MKKLMQNPFFKFFASLKLAVICILLLAAVLAYGTIAESNFGTRAAHLMVYGTWWFMGVLLLLGLNVLCAAFSRWPWRPRHYGFVITHGGIITILVGAYLTQHFGVDGNLPVVEGNQDNQVILSDLELSLMDEDGGGAQNFPVPETARLVRGKLMEIDLTSGRKLILDEFVPRAVQQNRVVRSQLPGVGAPAVHVALFNSRFNVDEWMLLNHPQKPTELNMGPAILSFRQLWTSADQKDFESTVPPPTPKDSGRGYVLLEYQGKQARLDLGGGNSQWRQISGTPYSYQVLKYFSYAVVENNELVNKGPEPVNPAVQLYLRTSSGDQEKHTVFANFPEFSTMHRTSVKKGHVSFPIKLRMVAGANGGNQTLAFVGKSRGQLQFAQSPDHLSLLYKVMGTDGKVNVHGIVKTGETVATGWMDLKFKVLDWYDAAVEDDTPQSVDYIAGGGEMNFLTGLHLVQEDSRMPSGSSEPDRASFSRQDRDRGLWLLEGGARILPVGGRSMEVRFGKKRMTLPFSLFLEKFHMGTDPGTSKAATYESNVTVRDPMKGNTTRALISMNEPLNYGGYTFYQASYVMEEGKAPISVFSVNYDPGRVVKYAGALIMIFGILLMFYFNPQYWDKILGNRKEVSV